MAATANDDTAQSSHLEQAYPHLGTILGFHRLENLKFCALGPGQTYYASWKGGNWSSWGDDQYSALFAECAQQGGEIIAASFGYGSSMVLSYGFPNNMEQLGYRCRLQGYYPLLYQFLAENGPLSIAVSHAIGYNTETKRRADNTDAL